MDKIITSNEQSLITSESTIEIYNITSDRKDDLPASIKLLQAVSKIILAIWADDSNCTILPDLFVMSIIKVLQTISVQQFANNMTKFYKDINSKRLGNKNSTYNTPIILEDIFTFPTQVYTWMFNTGVWYLALDSKPKSRFPVFIGRTNTGTVRKKAAVSIGI